MNYGECLKYLTGIGQEIHGVKFGLDTISCLLARLGNPHLKYPTAVVAGTNGKGSTSAILASILREAGYRTGLYSSPHLVRINERIQANGREITDESFARAFTEVQQAVQFLLKQKVLAHEPSFFEYLTATGFQFFAEADMDFVVLETGMGGRLDATNVTNPRVAVITNIGLDHVEFLGSTHAAIAYEKAGVIKHGTPVVSGCEQPEAAEVIRKRCAELGAELIETSHSIRLSELQDLGGQYTFNLSLNGNRFTGLRPPFLGRFQVKNAAAAVTAAWRLAKSGFKIDQNAILRGLQGASWAGRLEKVLEHPLVLLDGAHNPHAARVLAEFIREELAGRKLRLVYASMRDKPIGEISEILFPLAEEVYLTRPAVPRAASADEILAAARFHPKRLVIEPEPSAAVERACRASSNEDAVMIIGSLFLVGAVKKALLAGELRLADHSSRTVGSPA